MKLDSADPWNCARSVVDDFEKENGASRLIACPELVRHVPEER